MKVSAISYQTNPYFTGNDKKPNKIKSVAGAAVIALAAASPMAQADAQYVPIPYNPIFVYPTYTKTADDINTPKCFVVGDITANPDSDKTLREVFDEIDQNGNGVLTAKEVVATERANWNEENIYPFSSAQAKNTQTRFKALAKVYNQSESNPNTINFNEYKEIMNDYQSSDDYLSVPIYTYPYLYTYPPLYYYPRHYHHRPHIHHAPPPPPPRHHHHHR